ncbi:hypothetical protein BD779DRAFT_1611529 [Infundibulicybe gibba]|nr:hypothetical protein BD779DRAFT_1611529 [Infundibulicybe gibba]
MELLVTWSWAGHAPQGPSIGRRASVSGLTPGAPKTQRSSKTSHKLVVLPSAPQTRPLDIDEDLTLGHETDGGVREYKSQAERMTKDQRKKAGFRRITAYCVADSFKMKLLSSFLKREHNVAPRVFDEAVYVMYHLPLLPGYGPNTNLRSSVADAPRGKSILSRLSEAEENGYQGTYFSSPARSVTSLNDGFVSSTSPVDTRKPPPPASSSADYIATDVFPTPASEIDSFPPASEVETETGAESDGQWRPPARRQRPQSKIPEQDVAEVVFFEYGVVVFFGMHEGQEMDVLEDIENAGIMNRKIEEDNWEIEECHFAVTRSAHFYPRIYNDFFTLKSRSHLLKISISHALAQSTLLAHYETNAQRLTGRLFKLRRDINLVSNVLDVPELFWSEASLKELYDALDAIHDHLNNSAMERITWIVIWLIVVAILVELGEVIARLVVHATLEGESSMPILSKEEALQTLERMIRVFRTGFRSGGRALNPRANNIPNIPAPV